MLAGLFTDASAAERAHEGLFARGYRADEIVVVMAESKWQKLFAAERPAGARRPNPAMPEPKVADEPIKPPPRGIAGEFPGPIPIAVSSRILATRVMAAGRIARLLSDANRHSGRSTDDSALVRALADCGIPEPLTHACAAGVEGGRILLGVVPRSSADALALGEEWARNSAELPDS
jgi:hypothetical protein